MTERSDDIEEVLEFNPLPTEEDFESLAPGEVENEVSLEPQAHGGKLKRERKGIDPTGRAFYGDSFTYYQKLDEIRDLVPAYKEFYYQKMVADTSSKLTHIVRAFNDWLFDNADDPDNPRKFHPYTKNLANWKKKWDKDIMAKKGMSLEIIDEKKHVQQVLRTKLDGTKDGAIVYAAPEYNDLESGLQTLGGELLNDAMQMMQDDQALEEIYDADELIKRRAYIVNVFAQVTKMVHGKAGLMLKASAEKRENAHFLMDLMKKATAGTMTLDEINALRSTYTKPTTENVQPVS